MDNPYEAPKATLSETVERREPKRRILAISLVIAAFCVLQFWGVALAVARAAQNPDVSSLRLLRTMLLPTLLFLGGVSLLFRKKLCIYGFSAYVAVYLLMMGLRDGFGNLPSLVVSILFLVYSLWLSKSGFLESRPNKSFKPNPLRGSA